MKYTATGKWTTGSTFLPHRSIPVVIQNLTQSQIAAIPKEQYSVNVIGPTKTVGVVRNIVVGRISPQRHMYYRRFGSSSCMVHYKSPTLGDKKQSGVGEEQTFTTLIKLLDQAKKQTLYLKEQDRTQQKQQLADNGSIPDSGIFFSPIDEDEMSDCIYQIIDRYFHGDDVGTVCGEDYNLAQFCLLIHYFFRRTKLLKNESRQPFCIYLINKVFAGEEKFTVKTFNNYANRDVFQTVEPLLTDSEKFKTNFRFHPQPKGEPIKEAFQEIGWAFQHSEYFLKLKEQRKNILSFEI